jgi:Janus/Ocnus family (Ocnus).
LQFPDLNYTINNKGELVPVQSDRINKFQLETAWWTPFLSVDYGSFSGSTTNLDDLSIASTMRTSTSTLTDRNEQENVKEIIKAILPQAVQLSPGANKYVIIRAASQGSKEVKWFVKSASSKECGGPYHADVARDLLKELSCANYNTVVCGGGRIDYDAAKNVAHVYGFSYGFGKGDHEFVSLLIEKEGIRATFDNSDVLY